MRAGRMIVQGDGARMALMRGLDLVADAVAPTLGPAGSHVVLDRHDSRPLITNDGVTIARAIELLRDPYTNQGVQLLREVAGVTDSAAGDGTTTAVILARELLRQAFSEATQGSDLTRLCEGLRDGAVTAVQMIREAAEPLRDAEELALLAGNAARDRHIGEIVAVALSRAGEDGVVDVEDDPRYGVGLECIDGMSFAGGMLAPGLAIDEVKRESVLNGPFVLLANERITEVGQIAPALQLIAEARVPLIVIGDEISGPALTTVVLNVRKRRLPAIAVKAPLYGADRVAMLEDLAALTGARVLGPATGSSVRGVRLGDLGRAERATVTWERTTIEGGGGEERAIQARLSQIDAELTYLESEYERDKRRYRRACLTGTVAKIKIGLDTVVEQEETRLRVIDGIRAGRAAVRGGIVPGGGSMLVRVASALSNGGHPRGAGGSRVLIRALEAPLRQLAANARLDPAVALARVQAAPPGFGLDVRRDDVVDLRAAGVIDAADVVCTVLEAGISIALTALKAEAIIAQRPLPPMQPRPYGHHHGHDHGHFGGVAPGHEPMDVDGHASAHGHAHPPG